MSLHATPTSPPLPFPHLTTHFLTFKTVLIPSTTLVTSHLYTFATFPHHKLSPKSHRRHYTLTTTPKPDHLSIPPPPPNPPHPHPSHLPLHPHNNTQTRPPLNSTSSPNPPHPRHHLLTPPLSSPRPIFSSVLPRLQNLTVAGVTNTTALLEWAPMPMSNQWWVYCELRLLDREDECPWPSSVSRLSQHRTIARSTDTLVQHLQLDTPLNIWADTPL